MKNSKYNQVKTLWQTKNLLNEAAMDWKQSNGCFPSIGEFTSFVNECLGSELITLPELDESRQITDTDITWFANKLVSLSEDAADKFAGMSDEQFSDWVKSNKGAEEKARKLRSEGQARKTGGTATAEPPKAETPKTASSSGVGGTTGDPAEARREALRREYEERMRQQQAKRGTAPKAETPKASPTPTPEVKPSTTVGQKAAKVGKTLATGLPLGVGASVGQVAGEVAGEAAGAGSAATTGAEIAGAYYGEKAAIKGLDLGLKAFGKKPTGFKPSLGGAAGFVGGEKLAEPLGPWGQAAGSLAGGVVGEVGERAAMKTAAGQAAKRGVEKIAAKTVGKTIAKKIPGVGLIAGLGLGIGRLAQGDVAGAAGEVASGAASSIPGAGTVASLGIDAALAAKDYEEQQEDETRKQEEERRKRDLEIMKQGRLKSREEQEIERKLQGIQEGWLTSLLKAGAKSLEKPLVKDVVKSAEETLVKTAEKPKTIEIPVTHPIVKVEPKVEPVVKPTTPAKTGEIVKAEPTVKTEVPTKTGEIVKADTKVEVRPVEKNITAPETKAPASQTLPANKTKTPAEVATDLANTIKDILYGKPEIKPEVKDVTVTKPEVKTVTKPEVKTVTKPEVKTVTKTETQPVTKTETQPITKTETQPITKTETKPATKTETKTQTKTETKTKTKTPIETKIKEPPIKTQIKEPITTKVPPVLPSSPNYEPFMVEPEIPLDFAPGERYAARKRAASYDPFRRRFTTQQTVVSEGKLSPKESLQRKLKKQRYKISYVQDGKKVDVFASSIRGVRRVVYGKKQFRVYNSTGSDMTGYFKKLLNK